MARVRSRSPPPAAPDCPAKKQKTSHPANGLDHDDPTPCFAATLFDTANVASLHDAYKTSSPFRHVVVEQLLNDDLLKNAKDECLRELSFTEKETDIYKVNQTGDLASLNYLSSAQISSLPNLLALRNALYSTNFRQFLRDVTGCGSLSGSKQDMSVNSYKKGCHLLNHDDVIGTRRVSYILYMPLPHGQSWQKEWGGALELYPVKRGEDGVAEPENTPEKSIPPSWNQFIFFEVQPGKSFHSVEEVVVGGDGRDRLSISGWFHAAQEGEEGYVSESQIDVKSSREQLVSSSTVFKPYDKNETVDLSSDTPIPESLSDADIAFLSEYLNPVYMQTRTMKTLSSRFVEESSLELHSFLCNNLAETLERRLIELDAKDGLGPDRGGNIPPHTTGVMTEASSDKIGTDTLTLKSSSPWVIKGPPHKWRYCTLSPLSSSAPVTSITPLSAHPSSSEILRALQDDLFPSQPFRKWLTIISRLVPLRHNVEARRFRPGLDYTLATSEENEARLDVVLGMTPDVKLARSENGAGKRNDKLKAEQEGWGAAEWGGWECYMAPHNEEDDPAVYRSGFSKNDDVPSSINGSAVNHAGSSNGAHEQSMEFDDDDDDDLEEEDESTLLTVQPGFNRLLLVLRDEKVMRFVKYVSAAATGSRWDICGEYEVGLLQEDENDSDT